MALPDRHAFETGLDATQANFVPLSPVSFLTRAATAFADKVAVVDGERRYTYTNLLDRSVRLASALSKLGVRRLDTVAILASNIPELIEALYAVPMLGAVPALLTFLIRWFVPESEKWERERGKCWRRTLPRAPV